MPHKSGAGLRGSQETWEWGGENVQLTLSLWFVPSWLWPPALPLHFRLFHCLLAFLPTSRLRSPRINLSMSSLRIQTFLGYCDHAHSFTYILIILKSNSAQTIFYASYLPIQLPARHVSAWRSQRHRKCKHQTNSCPSHGPPFAGASPPKFPIL